MVAAILTGWGVFWATRPKPVSLVDVGQRLCDAVERGDYETLVHHALPTERQKLNLTAGKLRQLIVVIGSPQPDQRFGDDEWVELSGGAGLSYTRSYRFHADRPPAPLTFDLYVTDDPGRPVTATVRPLVMCMAFNEQVDPKLPVGAQGWTGLARLIDREQSRLVAAGFPGMIPDGTSDLVTWEKNLEFARRAAHASAGP